MKTLFVLLISVSSFAQNMIYVSGGVSIPTGDFGRKDYHNINGANFINNGLAFETGFRYDFKNHIGVTASFRYQSWDAERYNSPWNSTSLLIGGVYSIKIISKFFIEPKASIGYSIVHSPINSIVITNPGITEVYTDPTSAGAISFLFGTNFRYDISKKISLLLKIDYQMATPTFNYLNDSYSISQSVNNLNAAVGIGLKF